MQEINPNGNNVCCEHGNFGEEHDCCKQPDPTAEYCEREAYRLAVRIDESMAVVVKPKPRWMPKFVYEAVIRSAVEIVSGPKTLTGWKAEFNGKSSASITRPRKDVRPTTDGD